VWLCEDTALGELVAVKVLRADLTPAARERFRREASFGRSLRHPRLVAIYEVIDVDGRPGLVMEWVPGGTLAQQLADGPLAVDKVSRLTGEVLEGLDHLHARGIVHRDIKPSNLLFDAEGSAKLADFGLVRPLTGGVTITQELAAVGTPVYMSPEQLRNEKLTAAADLYALGVTLYEALAGRPPFDARSGVELVGAHLGRTPRDLGELRPDCPRWLRRFVHRLLEKRPQDRFPSAGAARSAFQRHRIGLSRKRLRSLVVAGAVVGVTTLAATLGLVRLADRASPPAEVEWSGRRLIARSATGGKLWRHDFSSPIQQAFLEDLRGDGGAEVLAASFPMTRRRWDPPLPSEVAILGANGEIVSSLRPESFVRIWPYRTPKLFMPWIQVIDLEGDGEREVLAYLHHRDALPSVLALYRPATGTWVPLVANEGYIHEVVAVPGARPPRLRMRAYNNELGMVHVVAELLVDLERAKPDELFAGLCSSPDRGEMTGRNAVRWEWYTLIEPHRPTGGDSRIHLAADGSTSVTFAGHPVTLDRFGNPTPGPNAGRDLLLDRQKLSDAVLRLATTTRQLSRNEIRAAVEEIKSRFEDLLRERPLQATLAIAEAKALMRTGATEDAIAVLAEAHSRLGWEDLAIRRAELEAISGRLDAAETLALAANRAAFTPAGDFRAKRLLVALSVEAADRTEWAKRAARFAGNDGQVHDESGGKLAALSARARLWWDEPRPEDESAASWGAWCPDGEVLGALARWRRGRSGERDLEHLARAVETSPEARLLGMCARSAVLSSLGRGDAALAELTNALPELEAQARSSFLAWQDFQLGRALYPVALQAAGRAAEARDNAAALAQVLRPGLLPRILVDEILATTPSSNERGANGLETG